MPDRSGTAGRAPSGRVGGGAAVFLQMLGSVVRRLAGMPDYAAYTEHLRCAHPERPIPTEGEFYDEFVRRRYEDGPTRCC
jgi:uncharacterized short protein YbdD (DUF466 family)